MLFHSEVQEVENESSKSSDEVPYYPNVVLMDETEQRKTAKEFNKIMQSFSLIDNAIDKKLFEEANYAKQFPKTVSRK